MMNHWGANHCVMTCGHVGHLYITLASMLRIPVYMHNVARDRFFRPSSWTAFGTADLEGADFRACQNYGPLYGKAAAELNVKVTFIGPPREDDRSQQIDLVKNLSLQNDAIVLAPLDAVALRDVVKDVTEKTSPSAALNSAMFTEDVVLNILTQTVCDRRS